MRIRTFTAPTMAEAMAQVRDALGPDAIIMSTYQGRRGRGVEVRAAVDGPPPGGGETPFEPLLTEQAAIDRALRARLQGSAPAKAAQSDRAKETNPVPPDQPTQAADLSPVGQALVFHRVPSSLGKAILTDARRFDVPDAEQALAAALELRFRFAVIPAVPARPLILVGPPGGGKTATAAKLATQTVLSGQTVTLLTTDTLKAGGEAQIRAFAERLDQPCHACDTPGVLQSQMTAPGAGVVYIDTPGTNPFNRAEIEDLAAFVQASGAEPVLVLPAGGDAADHLDAARCFREMGAKRVILTRIDATRRLGSALWVMHAAGLTFAQVSTTPYVAQGLTATDASYLAHRLIATARTHGPSEKVDPSQPSDPEAAPSPTDPSANKSRPRASAPARLARALEERLS